jgi:hypothetical protein
LENKGPIHYKHLIEVIMKILFLIFALRAEVTIPNVHVVAAGDGVVYRGAAPVGKEDQLTEKLGITDVIIFKNETKNEVQTEIQNLMELGISENQIHHFDFRWKDIESEQAQCEMIVEAMQIMKEVYEDPERSVFFHCTVGEDRTGMLAGLFKMVLEGKEADEVFQKEMCEKGYEAGNPNKPKKVVKTIREELTPTFVKMAAMIGSGKLNYDKLDVRVCKSLSRMKVDTKAWKCD